MKMGKFFVMVASAVLLLAGAAEAKGSKTKLQVTGVVNLNQATASQLDVLPGVGEKAAKRIIEHRQKEQFKRPEELAKVKGFGRKKFEKLKVYLTVAGPTTISAKRIANDGGKEAAQARQGQMQKR